MDPLSFAVGFVAGILFTWLLSRARPLLTQIRANAREQRQAAQTRRTSGLEDNYRRITLRPPPCFRWTKYYRSRV
jgi:hypothetical protein